ncbi:MAG: helix-turn-helix domain-containing protein [Bacilli bacterium]|nr:helix-turn-helix domain-containing protein [Bacilli bacterium]
MTLGSKLKKLRVENGLTQKDLAERLHVTFQTVSKWENGENEPDYKTLKQLTLIYCCTFDELLNEDEITPLPEEKKEEVVAPIVEEKPAPVEVVTKTVVIHEKEAHVCNRCKKDIPEDELAIDKVEHIEYHGRGSVRTYSDEYYHKKCLEELNEERRKKAEQEKKLRIETSKKRSIGWGIFAGVVVLAIALIALFVNINNGLALHPVAAIFISIGAGYAGFATLYCILSGSYIGDVFSSVAGWSVHFPGIIFAWDLEGFMWLIAMKILFFLLGIVLSGLVLAFAVSLSAFLAVISFPFILVHNIRTGYDDSLV